MGNWRDDVELTVKHPTGILLWKVSNLWVKAQNEALKPFGVTHSQFALLVIIGRIAPQGEEVTQTEMASISEMDPMVVSQSLRALEQKGLIRRETSKRDARAKAAYLTPAGDRLLEDAVETVIESNNRFYAALGERDDTLRHLLKDLLDHSERRRR